MVEEEYIYCKVSYPLQPDSMYNYGEIKRRKIGDLIELWSVFWNFGFISQLIRAQIKKQVLTSPYIYTRVSQCNHLSPYVTVQFSKTQWVWAPLLKGKEADLVCWPRKMHAYFSIQKLYSPSRQYWIGSI